jgi:hypothetical protein
LHSGHFGPLTRDAAIDEDTMTQRSSETIRAELLRSFEDYHSSIRKQTALLDDLIEAVRREERERSVAGGASAKRSGSTGG